MAGRAALGRVLLLEDIEGRRPNGLEELDVVGHALVQVDTDGLKGTAEPDIQEKAFAKKARHEARRDVCELYFARQAIRL